MKKFHQPGTDFFAFNAEHLLFLTPNSRLVEQKIDTPLKKV
jgi:hypothetical protein